jgi:predicted O-linked N-acetylglucosamine transferase (SPINDLY family)
MDERALQLQLERSRATRLRAWAVLVELRAILTGAGQELAKPAEKSFEKEGEILERALRKALKDRDEALRELATAARWVDRSAFGKEEGFAQAHQALLKALEKAGRFV